MISSLPGLIKKHLNNWIEITSDTWILQTVSGRSGSTCN